MKISRELTKFLIQLSPTAEEADRVIKDTYQFETVKEKIAFLKGMFGVETIGHKNDMLDEGTYFAMLNTIINS